MDATSKTCFVIAPIGGEGSEERTRSDLVFKYVIEEAVVPLGFSVTRADMLSTSGDITHQIILKLVESDLVVADLTGKNPNVFYEMAVRHAARKPIVHLIEAGESIPFDVAHHRTISLDHTDLASASACRQQIVAQIDNMGANPSEINNPLSTALDMQLLSQSGNLLERSNAQILGKLEEMSSELLELRSQLRSSDLSQARIILNELAMEIALSHDGSNPLTTAKLQELRRCLDGKHTGKQPKVASTSFFKPLKP